MPPLQPSEFHALIQPLLPPCPPRFAVAVSGGADSMALVLLTAQWAAQKHQPAPIAFTVDHGLRPESAREAAQVAAWLKTHGIAHHILKWKGAKPRANIQEIARTTRYDLLVAAAKKHQCHALLTAHHAQDQVETFFMRLARGSGVDGLSAMHSVSVWHDFPLLRPLLGISKETLIDTLKAQKQQWVEDPSNRSLQFSRVQMRQALAQLPPDLIAPSRVLLACEHLQRARTALEWVCGEWIEQQVHFAPKNGLSFGRAAFLRLPAELQTRCLSLLVRKVGGATAPLRFESLQRAAQHVAECAPSRITLAGCLIAITREKISLAPEAKKTGKQA